MGSLQSSYRRLSLKRSFLFFVPPFILLCIILLFVVTSRYSVPAFGFWSAIRFDKMVHLFIFGMLVFLLLQSFYKQQSYKTLRANASFVALLIGILYSGVTEIMQNLIFLQRSADVFDLVANSTGCLLGNWVFYRVFHNCLPQ